MYHGMPGTDFQCRCSMVMWDPEIDGKYEVKEAETQKQIENSGNGGKEPPKNKPTAQGGEDDANRKRINAKVERLKQSYTEPSKKRNRLDETLCAARILTTLNAAKQRQPNEDFVEINKQLYVARNRIVESEKSSNAREIFEKELKTAQALVNANNAVAMLSEAWNGNGNKRPDAYVNGISCDFKKVESLKKLGRNFRNGLKQADSVAIDFYNKEYRLIDVLKEFRLSIKRIDKNLNKTNLHLIFNGVYYCFALSEIK